MKFYWGREGKISKRSKIAVTLVYRFYWSLGLRTIGFASQINDKWFLLMNKLK